jgi:ABC-2 type transport system permease protein
MTPGRVLLLRLEFRLIARDRAALLSLAVLGLAVVMAVLQGIGQTERLAASHQRQMREQPLHLRRNVEAHGSFGVGNVLYYVSFPTWHEPGPWSRFAFGQRDVTPSEVRVRLLTLEGQLYDADTFNTTLASFGTFDLSFVFAFFVPLLIIALCYDSVSADREAGLWPLIHSQPVRRGEWLARRLGVRFTVAAGWTMFLYVAGTMVLGLLMPADLRWWVGAGVLVLYQLLWFGLSVMVVTRGWSSTLNALALGSLWMITAVAGPSLAAVSIATQFPIPDAFEATLRQREGYHRMWDQPRETTMVRFYRSYPEWAAMPVPADRFSWPWYYAMQHMGDIDAGPPALEFRQKLNQRIEWSWRAALVFPPVYVHLLFQRLAQTDLRQHLRYLDSIRDFHERLKRFWYAHLFRDTPIAAVDWTAIPDHRLTAEPGLPGLGERLAPFAGLAALALLAALWCVKRMEKGR